MKLNCQTLSLLNNLIDDSNNSVVFNKPFHSKNASTRAGTMQSSVPILSVRQIPLHRCSKQKHIPYHPINSADAQSLFIDDVMKNVVSFFR